MALFVSVNYLRDVDDVGVSVEVPGPGAEVPAGVHLVLGHAGAVRVQELGPVGLFGHGRCAFHGDAGAGRRGGGRGSWRWRRGAGGAEDDDDDGQRSRVRVETGEKRAGAWSGRADNTVLLSSECGWNNNTLGMLRTHIGTVLMQK